MKTIAIILGAGQSKRCGFDKIFHDSGTGTLIKKTLQPFQDCKSIDEIFLVLNSSQASHLKDLETKFPKILHHCLGGKERFDSLQNALKKLKGEARIIVHNGANPHITIEDLEASIKLSESKPNLIFGYFSPNSIKKVCEGKVIGYLDRDEIFETQTPQISTLSRLHKAITKQAQIPGTIPRDEAELLNLIGEKIYVYECSVKNQKITFPEDFAPSTLFGVGEDSHRFAKDFDPQKPVVLGGVQLPKSELSFEANSDGDVILHSLCNAILNALGEKTFDEFATPMCKEGIIDSTKYLEKTLEILGSKYKLQQVRISLEGLIPKIAPNHELIINNLSRILNLEPRNIGLTYTTGEQLTSFGKGEGMRATTYVILES